MNGGGTRTLGGGDILDGWWRCAASHCAGL